MFSYRCLNRFKLALPRSFSFKFVNTLTRGFSDHTNYNTIDSDVLVVGKVFYISL